MKVVVVGGGVVGITTALALAKSGCCVTVLERSHGVARGASFAPLGLVAPHAVSPGAVSARNIPALLAAIASRSSPLSFPLSLDPQRLRFIAKSILCDLSGTRSGRAQDLQQRLIAYSATHYAGLRRMLGPGLPFSDRPSGLISIYRHQSSLDAALRQASLLRDKHGVESAVLTADQAVYAEPSLAGLRNHIVGAIRFPSAEVGDTADFTRKLAEIAESKYNVSFVFGVEAATFVRHPRHYNLVQSIEYRGGKIDAERFVIAAGPDTARLLRTVGIVLPLCSLRGYSLTVACKDPKLTPRAFVMDCDRALAVVRLGDHIRVGGMAQLSAVDRFPIVTPSSVKERLVQELVSTLPSGAYDPKSLTGCEVWSGARCATPHGVPILGTTRTMSNVVVNAGHGSMGWTMAPGCAQMIADHITGTISELPIDPFLPGRL